MTNEQIKQEKKNFTDWFKNQTECDINIEPESVIAFSARKAAKEHAAEQGGWISVEEAVPSPDDTVLLRDLHNNMRSGYLDGDAEAFVYTDSDSWIDDGVITHWQPLPASPKKE